MEKSGDRLLRLKEVARKAGMGRSTIYRKMDQGSFPKPVRIDAMVRWRESDVDAWIASLQRKFPDHARSE